MRKKIEKLETIQLKLEAYYKKKEIKLEAYYKKNKTKEFNDGIHEI